MVKERKTILLYALLFIFWSGYSCTSEDSKYTETSHVLLVYLGGDNNLSDEASLKLDALSRGWQSDPKSKILVYLDSRDKPPRLLEIDGKGSFGTLRQYEEENSAGKNVFRRVITDTKALYPQASFNLLVFSHASGWLPAGTLSSPKSAGKVKTILADGDDEMELPDFAEAIPDKAFHTIIFEACFMAGIEVAYQLKDKANYIVASSAEILSPGFTYIFPHEVSKLVHSDNEQFIDAAFNYFNQQTGDMNSASFSLIKTDSLDALAGYIRQNCDFSKEVPVSDIQHFDRYSYHLFFDFEDYFSRLMPEDKREGLHILINNVVAHKLATKAFMPGYNGFTINKHSGLTTYIMQEEFTRLNQEYTYLDWYYAVTKTKKK